MAIKGAVARRYAEAVFDLGRDNNSVERWQQDLHFLAEVFRNRQLAFILSEPKIPFKTKEQIVREIVSTQVQPESLGLALLLAERGLVDLMPRIETEFNRLYDDLRNQAKAVITSALPLDAAEEAEIIAYLRRVTGKNITIEKQVDPAILGGVMARVGDTLIDGSVRHRLSVLREKISSGAITEQ
ncbi:MAG TPA: ATP synthase F1 subunit delta [Ktedonobacterales bacterium]|nr:ATP synthase F1 subunit delta [Ktedonobacterales bacterium]